MYSAFSSLANPAGVHEVCVCGITKEHRTGETNNFKVVATVKSFDRH